MGEGGGWVLVATILDAVLLKTFDRYFVKIKLMLYFTITFIVLLSFCIYVFIFQQ